MTPTKTLSPLPATPPLTYLMYGPLEMGIYLLFS